MDFVCVTLFDYTDTAVYQGRLKSVIEELEAEREAQRQLIKKLEEAHHQLLQSEKLASIGQLAAGVAHEINNPIGFVNSNIGSLDHYVSDLTRLIAAYEDAERAMAQPDVQRIAAIKREIDLEFLKEDVRQLITESREGLDRVKKIVQDLKDFSRVGEADKQWADLHKCLDSTLNVVWNELKYKAEVVKEYGQLPEVECVPSQLNQVFMNLLVNAAQAISEFGKITIRTGAEGGWVWVAVTDTGSGIAPENLTRIFDPFFTTKPVGKGTGLGLSVSYNIVQKHGGRIEVESEPGRGTTFRVWLPLHQEEQPQG
ncbi:MAG: ATP-binding protein [Pseudomonadota bacterium]